MFTFRQLGTNLAVYWFVSNTSFNLISVQIAGVLAKTEIKYLPHRDRVVLYYTYMKTLWEEYTSIFIGFFSHRWHGVVFYLCDRNLNVTPSEFLCLRVVFTHTSPQPHYVFRTPHTETPSLSLLSWCRNAHNKCQYAERLYNCALEGINDVSTLLTR